MQKNVIDTLNEVFQDRGLAQETLTPEVQLIDELGLDSFDLVQLVMAINQSFGIEIQSQEIIPENFETLASLIQLVKIKVG